MSDEKVDIFLWEPSGVNREQWPITTGVPFPKGALKSEKQICLWDRDIELPIAARITAKWDDGTVRWLLLDFQVDIAGNEKKQLILQFGEKVAPTIKPACKVSLVQTKESLTVENGSEMKTVLPVWI